MASRVQQIWERIDHAFGRLTAFFLAFAGVLIMLMAWVTSYGVIRRYALDMPEPYSYELATMFLLACVILSTAHIQRLGRHLRVDFVAVRFPESLQAILLNVVGPILALFYVIILTVYSWQDAWYAFQVGMVGRGAWAVPLFPMKVMVPIGAGMLCIVLIAQLCRGIAALTKRKTAV